MKEAATANEETPMRRCALLLLAFVAAAAIAPQVLGATRDANPVVKWKASKFGPILATKGHLALYTWNMERDKKVHCTGACAKAWPPLTIAKGTMVAKHVAGVMGTFGEIVRPDGRTQVTYNGRPVYTYQHDTPTKILCDGVDGWFVVRAH
jgi:predicted lipoprotein with Yx(FWY)xxD motif